ncbi:phosphatase PAP2 family protein [Candidatus Fermentibacterales bacterium]|nr:phosphatase PAP2 family protein [Candidatus Fermentibacterales bacterium]
MAPRGLPRSPLALICLAILAGLAGGAASSPLSRDLEHLFSRSSLLPLGAGAVATTAALLLECPDGHEGMLAEGAFRSLERDYLARLFSPLVLTSVAAAGYGLARITGDCRLQRDLSPIARGLLLSNLAAGALKLTFQRPRPDLSDDLSFPSAHAASACFLATYLWSADGWRTGLPAAVLSGLIGLSRIDCGDHYPSDVIAGSVIGITVGLAVAETSENDRNGEDAGGVLLFWDSDLGLGLCGGMR